MEIPRWWRGAIGTEIQPKLVHECRVCLADDVAVARVFDATVPDPMFNGPLASMKQAPASSPKSFGILCFGRSRYTDPIVKTLCLRPSLVTAGEGSTPPTRPPITTASRPSAVRRRLRPETAPPRVHTEFRPRISSLVHATAITYLSLSLGAILEHCPPSFPLRSHRAAKTDFHFRTFPRLPPRAHLVRPRLTIATLMLSRR